MTPRVPQFVVRLRPHEPRLERRLQCGRGKLYLVDLLVGLTALAVVVLFGADK